MWENIHLLWPLSIISLITLVLHLLLASDVISSEFNTYVIHNLNRTNYSYLYCCHFVEGLWERSICLLSTFFVVISLAAAAIVLLLAVLLFRVVGVIWYFLMKMCTHSLWRIMHVRVGIPSALKLPLSGRVATATKSIRIIVFFLRWCIWVVLSLCHIATQFAHTLPFVS